MPFPFSYALKSISSSKTRTEKYIRVPLLRLDQFRACVLSRPRVLECMWGYSSGKVIPSNLFTVWTNSYSYKFEYAPFGDNAYCWFMFKPPLCHHVFSDSSRSPSIQICCHTPKPRKGGRTDRNTNRALEIIEILIFMEIRKCQEDIRRFCLIKSSWESNV